MSNRECNYRRLAQSSSYSSYYPNSSPETVPFQWEKRPGLPKKLLGRSDEDIIVAIPLSPPPALHGLGLVLPRPDFNFNYDRWSNSQSQSRWTARFWRRISSAARKTCSSSSTSSARRVPSCCSVPISSDLRQLCDDGVMAAVTEGSSSSGLHYSSFSSNPLIQPFQEECCDENDGILVRRCSSAGESSRMYYYCGGTGGYGVPFNWEMHPGKSKHPGHAYQIEIIPPPPPPPPALQSRGLPMPESPKKVRSCFKYRNGSEPRLEEQPPFCCGLANGRRRRRRRRDFTSLL